MQCLKAAFKAAALAVQEEAQAARAAGGGDSGRLLASQHRQKARFEVHNDFRIDEFNESGLLIGERKWL